MRPLTHVRTAIHWTACITCCVAFGFAFNHQDAWEQVPADHPMSVYAKDVGTWKCQIRMWMDPNAPPETMEAEERNWMLGDNWLISDFQMEFMGEAYRGHGTYGFDAEQDKYIGTWIDSLSPYPMKMTGTWDAQKQTMTMHGVGKNLDGEEERYRMVTEYREDGGHVFTMERHVPGTSDEYVRTMEVTYTKQDD